MFKKVVVAMVVSVLHGVLAHPSAAHEFKTPNGKCLDVRGGNFSNRTPLQTYSCNGTWAQKFFFPGDYWNDPRRPHNASLSAYNGKTWCVDMPYTADGSLTWIFDCWGGSNQKWEIYNAWLQVENLDIYAFTPPPGNFQTIPTGPSAYRGIAYLTYTRANELRLPDGRCIDVPGWNTADHTKLIAYQCHGGANQKWYPNSLGAGIIGLGGMCLTAPTSWYGSLEIRPCMGLTGQKFRFGGRIRGDANKCLTTQPNPQDWWTVFVRTCDWSLEQHWNIALF